ncbi:XrtB/PEP-CTERM-associated transcriptional regulator EpsA [Methylotenera sp. L2L1]|uniref:XrtB/PEP-CTERM-associated transcriptional regulator EpsA n=1 Tax=Methylotenera sp. L2L1 TaxID=1502770 RepID=UPI00056B4510|nr:XrtB/PEP-CTERM-associated transcriptional regulator EpsA [Methylotenera sp. L2L1]
MKKESTTQYLNIASAIIERSYQIKTHLDYFVWLQNSVAELIPHDMLLAVWGDFRQQQDGQLHYDAASNLKGLTTPAIIDATDKVSHILNDLYRLRLISGNDCFAINALEETEIYHRIKSTFPEQLVEISSLLVYGMKDERNGDECLYIFFSKEHALDVRKQMMDFIMPHVDHVLRKIKPLMQFDGIEKADDVLSLSTLSEREIEVISWIKAGKTNQEIGMILSISQNTVKSHLKRIFQKLNIGRRAQAVALLANVPSTKLKQLQLQQGVHAVYS